MNSFSACDKTVAMQKPLHKFVPVKTSFFHLAVLFSLFLFSGCQKKSIKESANDSRLVNSKVVSHENNVLLNYNQLDPQILWELQQARSSTAKYRNISKAIEDNYANINVVVPNMGYHFMKSSLVDSVFDIRKPEILVYNRNEDGSFELVAVEYAVPIAVSPDKAPEGFTGSADVWESNTTFGLWLQHAWIWSFNPDGVFHDTNPLIQVH